MQYGHDLPPSGRRDVAHRAETQPHRGDPKAVAGRARNLRPAHRSSTGGFAALLPAAAVIPAIRAERGARGGGRFLSQQGCSAGRHGRLLEVFGFGLPRRGRGSLRPGPLRSADPHVGRRRGLVRQRAAHGTCAALRPQPSADLPAPPAVVPSGAGVPARTAGGTGLRQGWALH